MSDMLSTSVLFFKKSEEDRKAEATKIMESNPDKVPILLKKSSSNVFPNLKQFKYLVNRDITFGEFLFIIRKRIELNSTQALFLFVNNTLPSASSTLGSIYDLHKGEDKFLTFIITCENTFG